MEGGISLNIPNFSPLVSFLSKPKNNHPLALSPFLPVSSRIILRTFSLPDISFHFDFLKVLLLLSFPQECILILFFAFVMGGCICLHDSLRGDSQVLAYSWLSCMQSIFASFSTYIEGKERKLHDSLTVCPGKALWAWKPWVFIIQPEGGIHFYLNRGTQFFFRLELTILHETKKLYISMG